MFGYIVTNQPELKVKELIVYRSYYCGLCHSIKNRYGQFARLSLNYDLTFIALLLSSLDLKEPALSQKRCMLHPLTSHRLYNDDYTNYAADMTILLAYYKCQDDWVDDRNKKAFVYKHVLKKKILKIRKKHFQKTSVIEQCLSKINDLESAQSDDIDKLSSLFGKIMAEIMTFQNERWQPQLSEIGMHLGKFIYLMDAYEDLDKDIENRSFNVLISHKDDPAFETWIQEILTFQMARVCEAFHELPIVENEELLENILYSGVWTRYNAINSRKEAS